MPTSKLYFDPNIFSVVKEKATGRWYAVRIADTPLGHWGKLGDSAIECTPIVNGFLISSARMAILRRELDDAIFLPMEVFEYA
ncbi:MAG: hypothetical protein IT261_03625 [Saprospiraceae bacterium]|nr:hypothetical protein [Saprospiraceae bacterium]